MTSAKLKLVRLVRACDARQRGLEVYPHPNVTIVRTSVVSELRCCELIIPPLALLKTWRRRVENLYRVSGFTSVQSLDAEQTVEPEEAGVWADFTSYILLRSCVRTSFYRLLPSEALLAMKRRPECRLSV